jgi:hypothetical protein
VLRYQMADKYLMKKKKSRSLVNSYRKSNASLNKAKENSAFV